MNQSTTRDPFTVLGVSADAGEEEVRARYLELVKRFPPEREPEKFREIRAAFEAAKDPLTIARRLIEPPGDEAPSWSVVLEAQKRNPPRLSPTFLLSLGNRAVGDSAVGSSADGHPAVQAADSMTPSDKGQTPQPDQPQPDPIDVV